MSQFLRNIVARALGTAPSLQPRLQSRFEAVPPRETGFVEEVAEIPATLPRAQPAAATPMHSFAKADTRHVEPMAGNFIAPPPANANSPRALSHPARVSREDAAPDHFSAPAPHLRTSDPTHSPRIAPEPLAPNAPSVVVPAAVAAPTALPPRVNTLIVERVIEPQIVPPSDASSREPVRASVSPAPAPDARASVVPLPAATPVVASRAAEMQTPPPTVQVTIGRIEIRAVPAPAPAASRAPERRRAPVVSLEEYLQQRTRS